MSYRRWHRSKQFSVHEQYATRTRLIEAVDRTVPQTKAGVAEAVGLSEEYISTFLRDLKSNGVLKKAYVVDDEAVYEAAGDISPLLNEDDGDTAERGETVLELLANLNEVTVDQYNAACDEVRGDTPDQSADALEGITNERYAAVLDELKSYTLTTDWPGNRVAADLSTVATNLEIVGDRACFIADTVGRRDTDSPGVVKERLLDVFDAGREINELLCAVLFDGEADAFARLRSVEETVHRDLDELFELVTAYSPELYGHLVSVTRALERAIYYWVDAAEIAVRIHCGVEPDHTQL